MIDAEQRIGYVRLTNFQKTTVSEFERALWDAGHEVVVGIDEVGRGAWAGPLTLAAAVLPRDKRVYKVRDSKQLTWREREALFERIKEWCVAWGVGHASHQECDELGMSEAQRLAARRAIEGLSSHIPVWKSPMTAMRKMAPSNFPCPA